uniref:Uncharacterized protein n=1 Tax=Anguilla anguilla TaxID=7936 RepID=A0A0E9URG4_ANGAN
MALHFRHRLHLDRGFSLFLKSYGKGYVRRVAGLHFKATSHPQT